MTQETFSPVAQACIRIYRKQQNILVFEDFLLSDAYGMTPFMWMVKTLWNIWLIYV